MAIDKDEDVLMDLSEDDGVVGDNAPETEEEEISVAEETEKTDTTNAGYSSSEVKEKLALDANTLKHISNRHAAKASAKRIAALEQRLEDQTLASKEKEEGPLDKWLDENGDDDTLMSDVPARIQQAEAQYQSQISDTRRETQDRQVQARNSQATVEQRVADVMANDEAGTLLDMADKLIDEDERSYLAGEIYKAKDVDAAVAIAKKISIEVIEERGSSMTKRMVSGLKSYKATSKKVKKASIRRESDDDAETDDDDLQLSATFGDVVDMG